ncbi:MAG: hypothetical protein JWN99_453 [Ilumatobacteraceae bacterium]|nr:hypothetical protein [Ilumatobacteraceae bacterium]
MRTPPACLCIPVALVAMVAVSCGGGDDPTIGTNASPGITGPPAGATVATLDVPLTSDVVNAPSGSTDIALPPPVGTVDIPASPVGSSDVATPVVIHVTVGVDSDPERVEPVALGATVSLSVTDPDSDDEFHLHGYDLGDGVTMPAGQAETFTFVASQAGEFELESHETGDVLLVLSVA